MDIEVAKKIAQDLITGGNWSEYITTDQSKAVETLLQELDKKEENYISKDKIREKIEELNQEEQDLQNSISEEEREEYSDANISYSLMHIEIQRRILQELLENK